MEDAGGAVKAWLGRSHGNLLIGCFSRSAVTGGGKRNALMCRPEVPLHPHPVLRTDLSPHFCGPSAKADRSGRG